MWEYANILILILAYHPYIIFLLWNFCSIICLGTNKIKNGPVLIKIMISIFKLPYMASFCIYINATLIALFDTTYIIFVAFLIIKI